jgi:hypothetical protein
VRNECYTLSVRRLTDGDTSSGILVEFFGILDGLDLEVKSVILTAGSTVTSFQDEQYDEH